MLGAMAAGALALSLWGMALLLWSLRRRAQERRIQRRLDGGPDDGLRTLRLWHEGVESSVVVPGERGGRRLGLRLQRVQQDLGWSLTGRQALTFFGLGTVGLSALVASLTGSALNGAFAALLLVFSLLWIAGQRRTAREALFERQLVDGLELSARALRAGHPLMGSFRLIADEVDDPVGRIFADICQQHELGVDLEEALRAAAEECRSPDMQLFAASLSIHLRSGGNIADVVEGIAQVIRQRMRLARRVRVLTAQTQLSKRILLGMPLAVFAALHILNPGYARVLYETDSGRGLLLVAATMMAVGWLAMNRMASVRL
jgi:tight adherence protein B